MDDIRVAEPSPSEADADAIASILADGFADDPIRGTRQIEIPGGPSLLAMWREAEVAR